MLTILVCVVFISFSSNNSANDAQLTPTLPVYIPILFSFTVPVAQAANIMIAKRVTTVIGLSPRDLTFSCYFTMSGFFQICGLIYWHQNEGSF